MKIVAIAVVLFASCASADRGGSECRMFGNANRRLTVVVRHAESNAPLPRSSVILISSTSTITKETDEDGRVQFAPEVSRLTVAAHLNGFVPASSEIVVRAGYDCLHVLNLREDPEFALHAAQ